MRAESQSLSILANRKGRSIRKHIVLESSSPATTPPASLQRGAVEAATKVHNNASRSANLVLTFVSWGERA